MDAPPGGKRNAGISRMIAGFLPSRAAFRGVRV